LLAIVPQIRYGNLDAGGKLGGLLLLLVLLIPIGWWLLISRAIHEERLVGDTQFWITRPYEWKKLLAAKLLFLVIFVYLPVLAAYCILRAENGFAPNSDITSIHGLLERLLFMTGIVLPLVAIATVTSNFARMTVALLGSIPCMILAAVLPVALRPGSVSGPFSNKICFALTLLVCSAVIVIQYARRKTRLSVLLLIAIPVLICVIGLITPERFQMNRTDPPLATASKPT
jgi:hypothetical protein